jgi:multidrug resistance efflux pump
MKRYRIKRWLWCPLLAVSVVGAWWGYNRSTAGISIPAQNDPAASGLPGVICFGYVDVLPGITALYPTYPGRVSEVAVAEGEDVSVGAILVHLEDRLPRARLDEAKAVVEAARAQLAQAREVAEQHQARIAQLQAAIEALKHRQSAAELQRGYYDDLRGQFSEKDLNVARENVKEAAALLKAEREKLKELLLHDPTVAVRRAEAEVNVMQARLAQAQETLEQCTIRAPSAGTVLRVLVKPGDMLGTATRDPAVQFCPKGLRLVRAEVDQEFAGSLILGQKSAIQDDTKSGATWHGKVIRISDWYTQRRSIIQEPLQVNDVRTLECLIALDPGQPHLRIGQRVRVRIGNSFP